MQFNETVYNSYDTVRYDKKQHDTTTIRYVTVRYDTMWYGTIPWYFTNNKVKLQRSKYLLEKSEPTIAIHYHIEFKKKQNITKKQRIENILERRRQPFKKTVKHFIVILQCTVRKMKNITNK